MTTTDKVTLTTTNKVTLTSWEMMMGAQAGVMRRVENIQHGAQHKHGGERKGNDWQLAIEGALGEMALAKYLGLYWSGKGRYRAHDVGGVGPGSPLGYEVRTRSREDYDLILHPEDPDDRIVWLVVGKSGAYTVKGWIKAGDGKKDEYWKDPAGDRPAYFVPQNVLRPPAFAFVA
jgi:hypothetical protein